MRYKFLYSEALQRRLRLFVTPATLKRIDRAGGLDMYLLTNNVAAEGSLVGADLRAVIAAVRGAAGLVLLRSRSRSAARRASAAPVAAARRCAPATAPQRRSSRRRTNGSSGRCRARRAPRAFCMS